MPKIKKLNLNYGLGVGFNKSTVSSPFYSGSALKSRLVGEAGVVERCADLANDRIHKKTLAKLQNVFAGSDSVTDWIRQDVRPGLIVHLKKDRRDKPPIRLDLTLSPKTSVRVLVVAEAGAKSTVVIRRHGAGPTISLSEVFLEKGAEVNLVRVQNMEAGDDFSRVQAHLSEQAKLNLSECLFGGNYASSWAEAHLSGEDSAFRSRTLLVGGGSEKFDVYRIARHLAKCSKSVMNTTAVLADSAKAVERGLINIKFGAKSCSGTQKTDTIILNKATEFISQPQLEINEEDVQCSHAVAVGHLDQESMFYLMSRGLTMSQAKRRLVEGFVAPLLSEMKEVGMKEMVSCLMAERLNSDCNIE